MAHFEVKKVNLLMQLALQTWTCKKSNIQKIQEKEKKIIIKSINNVKNIFEPIL
jgi:hypothetical protein